MSDKTEVLDKSYGSKQLSISEIKKFLKNYFYINLRFL